MSDLETLRGDAVLKLRAAGEEIAANFLALKPSYGERGWVAQWHIAIQFCDDVTMDADMQTAEIIDANVAVMSLFHAMCKDHEESRRCASR